VGTYVPVILPIPMILYQGKLKLIPRPTQRGENLSNRGWFGQVTASMFFFLPCLDFAFMVEVSYAILAIEI